MKASVATRLLLASLAAISMVGGVVSTSVGQEDFAALVKRTQAEKPRFAERQQKLLVECYDLADRPAKGESMSRGKLVQEGVRVRLPQVMTWEKLEAMSPADIKSRNLWPAGFYHPKAPSGSHWLS